MLPRIAIVGRPNVGKSALFNRLAKRRISIVHDKPGVTRDRIAAQCWIGKRDSGFHFELTDTGGIGATLDDGFAQATRAEADVAINAAELILFVVDGREGIHPIDRELSHLLRRGNTPVIVVANKVDTKKTDPSAAEFAEFGYEHQVNVSATHGRNMDVLEQLMIDNFTNQQGSFDETTGSVREALDLFAISAAPTEFEWDDVELTEKSEPIRTVYEQHDLQPCRFRDLSEAGNGSSNERSDDSVHETYPERLERAARASTGANPEFFRAGTDEHRNTIGFVADGVIFINVELEVAFGWTFAHEFGHIAEKKADSGYETYVESLLTECMSPEEVEAIRTHAFAGIEDDFEVATEIANHVLGDATGTWSSGILDFLEQDDAAEDLALIFLEGILPSSPVPEKRSSAQTIEDEELARTPFEPPIKIAIVGRPNVGKSSLINAILNDQRSIVSDVAGTTRDAVDVPYSRNGKDYVLIDTAGIRKRVKRDTSVEVFSVMRSETSIQRADICLLVIDASSGVVSQDRRIAKMVLDAQKPCILLLNKFDLYFPDGSFQDRIDQFREDMGEDMFFLDYAPRVAISAKERQYLGKIFKQIQVVKEGAADPIPTGVLNRLLRTAIDRNPPPAKKGKRMKLLYATQKREDKQSLVPVPEYMLFLNYANLLTRTYERYLENKIREEYPMEGLPFIFSVSSRQGRNLETDRR